MPILPTSFATPRADLGEAFREYSPEGMRFVALDVMPSRPVALEAGTLSVIRRENLTLETDTHSNGAAFERVNMRTEDLSYACVSYGLEAQLTDRDRRKYVRDYDAELETVQMLKTKQLLMREYRTATALFNTTTWTGSSLYTDDSTAAPWSTTTTDVITTIAEAKAAVRLASGYEPDSLLINSTNLDRLLANTVLLARFPGAPVVTEQMLRANIAALFGLQNLYVGYAAYNGANEGLTFSGSNVWSNLYALVFKRHSGTMADYGLGRTLVWQGMGEDMPDPIQYREEQTASDVYRVELYEQQKVFDANAAHLIKVAAS